MSSKILENINLHIQNRRKGFYFWTTKKNFLTIYIFNKILINFCIPEGQYLYLLNLILKNIINNIENEKDFEFNKNIFLKKF